MAFSAISFANPPAPSSHEDQFAALKAELKSLLQQSLSMPTFDAWLDYWHREERLETFTDLFRAFRRKLANSPEAQREQAAHQLLMDRLPQKSELIAQIQSAQNDAGRIVRDKLPLPLRSADLRVVDAECAASFNHFQVWYVIGMNSLLALSAPALKTAQEREPLLDALMDYTLHSALESRHTAYEGAQLRELPTDDVHLTFHTEITRTEDQESYLGACAALDVMTSGESEDEVADLLGKLVKGYLRAEANRGMLPALLESVLHSIGALPKRRMLVRVYSHSGDASYTQFVVVDLAP